MCASPSQDPSDVDLQPVVRDMPFDELAPCRLVAAAVRTDRPAGLEQVEVVAQPADHFGAHLASLDAVAPGHRVVLVVLVWRLLSGRTA
jgi:hypothetical protein